MYNTSIIVSIHRYMVSRRSCMCVFSCLFLEAGEVESWLIPHVTISGCAIAEYRQGRTDGAIEGVRC